MTANSYANRTSGDRLVTDAITRNLARAAPWLARLALAAAGLILAMIARKFILDPVGSAAVSQTRLDAPIAITNMRASFGAFPLACALVALASLTSRRLHLGGLAVMASVIGSVLLVRIAGILVDGTYQQSHRLLAAEGTLLGITLIAIFAELARRSIEERRAHSTGG